MNVKKGSYFEAHPRPKTDPRPKATSRSPSHNSPPSPSSWRLEDLTEPKDHTPTLYTFPTSDNFLEKHTRSRTRTGPSTRSSHADSSIPPLRFSGASSLLDTPPQTPIDSSSIRQYSFDHFPAVVSAPVAGVEAMDAMVDGMNGVFSAESCFSRSYLGSRLGAPSHHPAYHPPLPTPPPGIVLGKGKGRREDSDEDDDDDTPRRPSRGSSRKIYQRSAKKMPAYGHAHASITEPRTRERHKRSTDSDVHSVAPSQHSSRSNRSVVPSISEIVRAHAPPSQWSHSSTTRSDHQHFSRSPPSVVEDDESEPEPLTPGEEAEMLTRSSIDSIADEVRRSLRSHKRSQNFNSPRDRSFPDPPSLQTTPEDSTSRPYGSGAVMDDYSQGSSTASLRTSLHSTEAPKENPVDASQAIAEYLRSPRLTTILKLHRGPHASPDHPLQVSLSDMGDPNGFPVVVFLGLGCVRHVTGLYDEMADCLGLRLIAIDRWGLGRTDVPSLRSSRGVPEWASAVEEVLDILGIYDCSIMAHSAGAPYALSFANRVPERIRGDICLLAPWVGGGEGGYKWLKYVPNGILKTAQAAEWKIQAWMIGKPPTIAYNKGIGYTVRKSPTTQPSKSAKDPPSLHRDMSYGNNEQDSDDIKPRVSTSSAFSDYDDLRDFDGRFGSQSTLGACPPKQPKPKRSFLGKLKVCKSPGKPPSQPSSPALESPPPTVGRKLKNLRSMGSLKSKASSSSAPGTMKKADLVSPLLPQPSAFDGLGLGEIDWEPNKADKSAVAFPSLNHTKSDKVIEHRPPNNPRDGGRRSVSFSAASSRKYSQSMSLPASPPPSTFSSPSISPPIPSISFQAALGSALIAASHAEASKGTHSDLLQVLNHDNRPWGFSYTDYPHHVHMWYGDRDEKIAENAVRWMERTMTAERCSVKVVKGADHSLMYKSSVVVEVLERIREFW
ncbi:hypothetical protein CONPUDRAFT_86484 [Coniophora puteana RWD-64-598 SS2]|uniref:Alpha beta-hydrolase n=1 Tax=Coniophora puteana (strain RWD-64-598) TaxID=741705 RepID=A0A5M3N5A6_CONPW|nr:uncharacterized protein CONPUDRAFT_86484 [Coniophora puteana RWD-64-598 SS2]EIW86488.1 hypothetical protein CONPUDRAFT_86484 [Coniophora puteana RWD-64-598 SS2]